MSLRVRVARWSSRSWTRSRARYTVDEQVVHTGSDQPGAGQTPGAVAELVLAQGSPGSARTRSAAPTPQWCDHPPLGGLARRREVRGADVPDSGPGAAARREGPARRSPFSRAHPSWWYEEAPNVGHVPQLELPREWTAGHILGWLPIKAAQAARETSGVDRTSRRQPTLSS